MMGILEWVICEMAKFGDEYFGVATMFGDVGAFMFSEDGVYFWHEFHQVHGAVLGMFGVMMGVW